MLSPTTSIAPYPIGTPGTPWGDVEKRAWLAGSFSIADIMMADVLRLVDRFDGLTDYPACRAYVARATARPAFVKAHADQMAHFAAGDAALMRSEARKSNWASRSARDRDEASRSARRA